jgi:hypothetical protein
MAIALTVASCGHARTVEPAPGHERPPFDTSASSAHKPEHVGGGQPSAAPPESAIPLATTPAGLLKAGAAKLIQERLARAGALARREPTDDLDEPTRAALARFQRDQGLPATGDPDGATVGKLGLRPEDVFSSGKDAR